MKTKLILLFFAISSYTLTAQNEWLTYYEPSGAKKTPRYEETMSYCRKLANASPMVYFSSFGTSPQGRDLAYMVIDKEGLKDPEAIKATGRLILMIQACIHPGESEGKDAGLMLIRDIIQHPTSNIQHLTDHISILFIPIFNVDGHERFGPYNRINQNGPEEMGWRTTATNLNLNRDFLKADAPEMQAWLKLFNRWLPDFFIDTHTTNGADYQYVLTYMMEILGQMDPGLTRWCRDTFLPRWEEKMYAAGFPVFPYVHFRRWHDPRSGLISDVAPPMLSQGYVALRNRPGLLVETHMLKPYQNRVESTYECIVSTLEILNQQAGELKKLNRQADSLVTTEAFRKASFPLQFETSDTDSVMVDFLGIEYEEVESEITGGTWYRYNDTPATFRLPWFNKNIPSESVMLPGAYIIPPEWKDVIEKLRLHGISMRKVNRDTTVTVTFYKFKDPRWRSSPYEGRHPVYRIEYNAFAEEKTFPAGSMYIETAQPGVRVLANILEPKGDGSLVWWGFFDPIFEQKEYAEYYMLEPMAEKMLARDPELKREFEAKLNSDSTFAKSQRRILYWFYEKTPYWDQQQFVYPVGRIEEQN